MEVENLLQYNFYTIKIDDIKMEYKKWNYFRSANLSNDLLIKITDFTNMNTEIKEILKYKRLSDSKINNLSIR